MNDSTNDWVPCKKIEDLYEATTGNQFSGINRPTSGSRTEKALPEGDASLQLYSLATPNGQKIGILLEELLEAGCDSHYDAHLIDISSGDQFTSGFVAINPNSKIPSALDKKGVDGKPVRLFESGAICLYLAEKFSQFIPKDAGLRAEMMNWAFWQMGSQGPMTGQFGHFFVYAPGDQNQTRDYGAARYGMEVQRLCDVLDKALAGNSYLVGDQYSLADILIFPWFYQLQTGYVHKAGISAKDFLSMDSFKNACRWSEELQKRPGVIRGLQVCDYRDPSKGTKPWLASDS